MPDQPPVLFKAIPPQVVNEGAAFGPLNLNDFIQSPVESGVVEFVAELSDGRALTKGLICTSNGTLSGIPGAGTQGTYEIIILAKNKAETPLTAKFTLTIKERISMLQEHHYFTELKSKVWEALGQDLPLPDISKLLGNTSLTLTEIYYLMQRFATLTIWDVYNLEVPGDKLLLDLEGASPHFQIYDRGSCLVGAPKDLFSYERTLEDALQTARVMMREAYKRNWTVELAGFNKMVRASWVEAQLLIHKHGKPLEILYYQPTEADQKLYQAQEKAQPGAAKSM